jgi:hypothetical protein
MRFHCSPDKLNARDHNLRNLTAIETGASWRRRWPATGQAVYFGPSAGVRLKAGQSPAETFDCCRYAKIRMEPNVQVRPKQKIDARRCH